MSLVTRCPACATTFKVVRDQLRISEGWVRCGRCSQVFDATVDLHEVSESAPAPASAADTAPAPAEFVSGESAGSSIDVDSAVAEKKVPQPASDEAAPGIEEADFFDDEHETAPPAPAPAVAPASGSQSFIGFVADEPWPERAEQPAQEQVVPPLPTLPPFPNIDLNLPAAPPARPEPTAPAAEDTGNVQLQKALRRARAKSAKAKAREEKAAARASAPMVLAASEPVEPSSDIGPHAPGFSGAGEASPFWGRVGVRRSLPAAAALAALLLVVQVLHQERDLIVARQPALRPAFAALCGLTGCQLAAPRQIGDITVDGASFAREKSSDAFRLSFTLRSAAAVPLAMPAVELSLLDTQERAVVRRVLLPGEFGAPAVLPARADLSASLSLTLTDPEAAAMPPVAGYRLEPFYP